MERYGHIDRDGYPLAAWIWGHRLRIGQHWMEYLLEFLNVLAGFGYELGQGVDSASKQEYTRFTRLGLRRFVFYDEREKTRHPFDEAAREYLLAALRQQVVTGDGDELSGLEMARSLLRAFSAIEEQRSWFAKSLFPAHHNFLFWEALRKGATKYKGRHVPTGTPRRMLDADIAFDARNFFARGGELYYLMLSAGTEENPERRQRIVGRLRELLNDHNQALGLLAEIIDRAWQSEPTSENGRDKTGRLGWLPDPACPLYTLMAEDVDTFLQTDLDPLETLDLLAHLIGFHLTLYIYHRAHPDATPERHADGSCREMCRPALLIDALEGTDSGTVRGVSAALFREQEARIVQKGRAYVQQQVEAWAAGVTDDNLVPWLDSEARAHFNLGSLHGSSLNPFNRRVDTLLNKFNNGSLDRNGFIAGYVQALTDLLLRDFDKNFLGVHRKLAKAVGFVAPRKGPSARFVLGDNLLKALILATLSPGSGRTYDEFLTRLYERYGLVVGTIEARESGLLKRQRINAEYYNRNRSALLEKMKHAGLAVEYSDATAVVRG